VPVPVPSLDAMHRPVVTLWVSPSDSSDPQRLVCHIDTGADFGLVLRSHAMAVNLGLDINDRSAIYDDREGAAELADGTPIQYIIGFLFVPQWFDGKPRWTKVFIPPPPDDAADSPGKVPGLHPANQNALLGLDLLRRLEFRLCISRGIVELSPVDSSR
jgi:hypothetical protein